MLKKTNDCSVVCGVFGLGGGSDDSPNSVSPLASGSAISATAISTNAIKSYKGDTRTAVRRAAVPVTNTQYLSPIPSPNNGRIDVVMPLCAQDTQEERRKDLRQDADEERTLRQSQLLMGGDEWSKYATSNYPTSNCLSATTKMPSEAFAADQQALLRWNSDDDLDVDESMDCSVYEAHDQRSHEADDNTSHPHRANQANAQRQPNATHLTPVTGNKKISHLRQLERFGRERFGRERFRRQDFGRRRGQ